MKCREKSCPFPANEGEEICRYHEQLFALDISPSELSVRATEEDISSALFYDQSITVANGGMVPIDEWIEDQSWSKLYKKLTTAARYKRRRDAGLCIHCETPTQRDRGSLCRACLDKRLERRRGFKLLGICVSCGTHPAATGSPSCLDCVARHRIASRRSYAKGAALRPKRQPAPRTARGTYISTLVRRQNRKALGICNGCGKRHETKKELCAQCSDAKKKYGGRKYKSLRKSARCVWCRRRLAIPTKSHCDQCAQRNQEKAMSLYKTRKRKRLCVSCGGRRDRRGLLMCSSCSKALSRRWKRRQLQRRVSAARGGGVEVVK